MNTFIYARKQLLPVLAITASFLLLVFSIILFIPSEVEGYAPSKVKGSSNASIFQFTPDDPNYLAALAIASAQEAKNDVDVENKVSLDEEFVPEDFDLNGVGLLPTSPFYFLKNARRGITSVFTFDPVSKAELNLQFAAEKILEVQELASGEDVNEADVRDALSNFTNELAKVRARIETASTQAEKESLESLASNLMDAVIKYQKLLGKLEKTLSSESFDKITEVKDSATETFGGVFDIADSEKISEELIAILEKQGGSEFKQFKNIEVLKEVESKISDENKDSLKLAQETALIKLQAELEKFAASKQAIFSDFVKDIGGSELRHLEIINELEVRPLSEELRSALLNAKEEVYLRTDDRLAAFSSQAQQEKFLEHLNDGNLEDIRLVNDLENNVSIGVLTGIANVRQTAEGNFQRRIETIDSNEDDAAKFFASIERFHDAKSIGVLDEIENLIPEDKRAFFDSLKQKVVDEIQKDIARAADESQKQVIYRALAGDHPKYFESVDRFGLGVDNTFVGVLDGIRNAQYQRINDRVESINDEGRLLRYETAFQDGARYFVDEPISGRGVADIFREKRIIFGSPEKATEKIAEAEPLVAKLRALVDTLPLELGFTDAGFDPAIRDAARLLALSERKLSFAKESISLGYMGRAFAEAQEAGFVARDGISLAQNCKSGKKVVQCPFLFPPQKDFCRGGTVVRDIDFNGCELPARCEYNTARIHPTDPSLCGGFGGYICPEGFFCEFTDASQVDGFGKCVESFTCDAFFTGYVYDEDSRSCFADSTSGCSDPFVYHSRRECEDANLITEQCIDISITDVFCQADEELVTRYSSPGCVSYFGCEKNGGATTSRQCNDGVDNDNDGLIDYPNDPGCFDNYDDSEGVTGVSNWVSHTWKFSDGQTVTSQILNRTDKEYTDYISSIGTACLAIPKSQFDWKKGAGNDDSDNWRNFGIPDCSVTTVVITYQCNDGTDNDNDGLIDYPSDPGCTNSSDDSESGGVVASCSSGTYTTDATCTTAGCTWYSHADGTHCDDAAHGTSNGIEICNDGIDNDNDGLIDSADPECGTTTGTCTYTTQASCETDSACEWGNNGCGSKPTTGYNCPSGFHHHTENGGYCSNDTDDPNGTCYDYDESTNTVGGVVSCVTSTNNWEICSDSIDNDGDGLIDSADPECSDYTQGSCPNGYHYHDFNGGICEDDNHTGDTCYDGSGATIIACPEFEDSFQCDGDGLCESSESSSSCPSDCGSATGCGSYASVATCHTSERCVWSYSSSSCSRTSYDGDETSCPGFSSSTWDASGVRYCKLSSEESCQYNYPDYLTFANYASSNCPVTTAACLSPYDCINVDDCTSGGYSWCASDSQCYSDSTQCATITTTYQCNDGVDNDSDGLTDYPSDPGCTSSSDNEEGAGSTTTTTTGSCPSGFHYHPWDGGICEPDTHTGSTCYDGSGAIAITCPGFGSSSSSCDGDADTSQAVCTSYSACVWDSAGSYCYPSGGSDTTYGTELCGDGIDNDGDGLIDSADPGCSGTSTGSGSCPSGFHYHADSGGFCESDSHTGSTCYDSAGATVITCPYESSSTTACNYDGVCDSGESSGSCASDCSSTGGGGGTTSCYSGGYTTTTSCEAAGCVWYAVESGHSDTHCDDAAHGTSGGASLFFLSPFLQFFGF